MLVIEEKDVKNLSHMEDYIKVMRETLGSLSRGKSLQILRTAIRMDNDNILGVMPSYIKDNKVVGTKVITVFTKNHKIGKPSHQGVILVFDSENGELKAIVDGIAITAYRTAAVSAIATDLLARKNSKELALLGAGVQARSHLEAMLLVRDVKTVKVWDLYLDASENFAIEMSKKYCIEVVSCKTVEETVKTADIICTLTPAKEPILFGKWLKKGVHINAVGACTPDAREVDTETVIKSKLYVDKIESTINEAGDYIIPLNEGAITQEHIVGEIGDIIINNLEGRKTEEEITMFEALGLAVEDLAAANHIYKKYV